VIFAVTQLLLFHLILMPALAESDLTAMQVFWTASMGDWALLQVTWFTAYLTMMVFMLLAFWFVVGQAKRVQRLMNENPELQLQRKRLGVEERSYGGVADEAYARRNRERKRSHAMQLRVVLVGVGVLVLGGSGIWAMTRPLSTESAVPTFKEHWQAKDLDKI
jgi:hypothetical protein